jgi:3-oxoacyl-[acyl-carrier-protein] synthase II
MATAATSLQLNNDAVVITGMGLATSLGLSVTDTWAAVIANRSGAGPMPDMESPLPPGKDGCQAPPLPADFEPSLPREVRYLRWTITAALRDAGLADGVHYDPWRCAVMLGTTLHGMRSGGRFLRNHDYTELRAFLAGDTLRLAVDGLGFGGAAATTCSACSSSLGSIALGVTMLRTGQADLVVAGGYDAISEYAWAGFNSLRLVTDGPLRPFSRGRTGMKIGEGYAVVVLERAIAADARRAPAKAFVLGFGESADAHHLTQPHATGEGARCAMRAALDSAGVEPQQLSLVAAHATGTPDNDASERAALVGLFGEQSTDVPVVAFKSHLGHTLGGAGAAELILSVMAIRDGIVPACANVTPFDVEYPDLHVTTGSATRAPVDTTLNTSLGFGGANTCIVLGKRDTRVPRPLAAIAPNPRHARDVWITGIGVLLPGAIGNAAFIDRLASRRPYTDFPTTLTDADYEHLLNARRVRRLSGYTKRMLAAAAVATGDAGLADRPDLLADTAGMLGTAHGSGSYCTDYYAQIVREGVAAANPLLFAEGVPNVGAAHLSMMLGLKGACQTIIGSRSAGLDALRLAWLRIAAGTWDRAVVGAAEEDHEVVSAAYDACGLRTVAPSAAAFSGRATGFNSAEGAISFVLESADTARARGATPYAVIRSVTAVSNDRELLPRTVARLLDLSPPATRVIASGNATWIDRAEAAALSRPPARAFSVGSTYDLFAEMFSVTPLLAIAATMLTRSLPAFLRPPTGLPLRPAPPGERLATGDMFTTLCTDWNGTASSATLALVGERSAG